MILSRFSDLAQQVALPPNMRKAIQFLQSAHWDELPSGRVAIDDDQVFAIISSYTTHQPEKMVELEAHQKYIDIQYILSGREVIGWASAENVLLSGAYNPEKDAWNGNLPIEQLTFLHVDAGQATIFYPTDAHAPQIADGAPCMVRKVVVKVAIQS